MKIFYLYLLIKRGFSFNSPGIKENYWPNEESYIIAAALKPISKFKACDEKYYEILIKNHPTANESKLYIGEDALSDSINYSRNNRISNSQYNKDELTKLVDEIAKNLVSGGCFKLFLDQNKNQDNWRIVPL